MVIDFSKMEEKVLPHFMGGEGELRAHMRVDELGKILHGTLNPGCSIGLHTHDTSSEIIYVLKGTGKVICDGVEETVPAGMCHYCPKGHSHTFINDTDQPVEIFAVVPVQ